VIAPLSAVTFYLIDMFDGALQAFIFTILTIMYLAIVVTTSLRPKVMESPRLDR